jgi:hypothetical protein
VEFEKNTDSSMSTAKMVLGVVKKAVPPPFNLLATAALAVVQLAENAVTQKMSGARLAHRISRITFVVLKLTTTVGSTDAVLKCAQDLTAVFQRAVALLEQLGGRSWTDLSWLERVRLMHKKYTSCSEDKFTAIHEELNCVMTDFAISDALQLLIRAGPEPSAEANHEATRDKMQLLGIAGPSAQQVREASRDELALVVEDIQNVQETLLTKPFSDLPEPQRQRDPRDVILDKNTVLGGSLTSIRSADRDELTHFLEEFQWLKQEMEACARGASECRVSVLPRFVAAANKVRSLPRHDRQADKAGPRGVCVCVSRHAIRAKCGCENIQDVHRDHFEQH